MMGTAEIALKRIVEAALLAAGRPLTVEQLLGLFEEAERPQPAEVKAALAELGAEYEGHAMMLQEVGSGFRVQIRREYAPWVSRLWDERPGRYSRALLETLAIIAYRQPVTRGEIEEIRGVAVSSSIIKTLSEREWVRVVGHREVPGKPALYATTRHFLDYFNLKSLDELPPLQELRNLDEPSLALVFSKDPADHAAPPNAVEEASGPSGQDAPLLDSQDLLGREDSRFEQGSES